MFNDTTPRIVSMGVGWVWRRGMLGRRYAAVDRLQKTLVIAGKCPEARFHCRDISIRSRRQAHSLLLVDKLKWQVVGLTSRHGYSPRVSASSFSRDLDLARWHKWVKMRKTSSEYNESG